MIPRFSYSFSLRKAWRAVTDLGKEPTSREEQYNSLFPGSTVYELSSARQGLTICLSALQLGKNARVGVQPYTCSSVLVAIEAAGCRPVFIDINSQLTLDSHDLAQKINTLDALLVTHTFGIAADIDAIKKIVGRLPVIEDCAHAFLCKLDGQYLGTQFDLAVFSFGNGKFPAMGSGGLLVVNTPTYKQAVSRAMGQLKKNTFVGELTYIVRQLAYSVIFSRIGYQIRYRFIEPYTKERGRSITKLPVATYGMATTVKQRIRREWAELVIASARQRQLAVASMNIPTTRLEWLYNPDVDSNCFTLACLTDERDQLYTFLVKRGIGAGKHFQQAQFWATAFGYEAGSCPAFERILPQILTLPCHYTLTTRDAARIEQALIDYEQISVSMARRIDSL